MLEHEKAQSLASYAVGGSAIFSPYWMGLIHDATDLLQFLTVLAGFVIVVLRLKHDWKNRKE